MEEGQAKEDKEGKVESRKERTIKKGPKEENLTIGQMILSAARLLKHPTQIY